MKENLLKNWSVQRHPNGHYLIMGDVYNDSKNRFKDGSSILTSKVKNIDFENGKVETQNTVYNLELESEVNE